MADYWKVIIDPFRVHHCGSQPDVILTLKPEAGIVVRAEVAKGESDEATFYLNLGNSF